MSELHSAICAFARSLPLHHILVLYLGYRGCCQLNLHYKIIWVAPKARLHFSETVTKTQMIFLGFFCHGTLTVVSVVGLVWLSQAFSHKASAFCLCLQHVGCDTKCCVVCCQLGRLAFSDLTWLGSRKGIRPVKNGGDGRGGHWLVRIEWHPAGRSVCLPLLMFPCNNNVQKFSSGTGSPGWSRKKAVKRLWCGSGAETCKTFVYRSS